jgi:hypothetical protein
MRSVETNGGWQKPQSKMPRGLVCGPDSASREDTGPGEFSPHEKRLQDILGPWKSQYFGSRLMSLNRQTLTVPRVA